MGVPRNGDVRSLTYIDVPLDAISTLFVPALIVRMTRHSPPVSERPLKLN